ncbi:hypothetical protein Pcinc_032156 [Petrolisthes cinctipes]|uniref:Uncharacterized protein n=1 Tax=Petrolisthes cinctipes TaxID=88211 RepID=A0AAE1EUW8_PETCI|nr:hypothetical protein Pcinc_032156 [Petrolisthes cinctipes]
MCVLLLLLIVNGHTLLPLLTLENQGEEDILSSMETTEPLTLLNLTEWSVCMRVKFEMMSTYLGIIFHLPGRSYGIVLDVVTQDGCSKDSLCFDLDIDRHSTHKLVMAIRLSVWQHLCISFSQDKSLVALNDKVKKYQYEDGLIAPDIENGVNLTIRQISPPFFNNPVDQPMTVDQISDLRLYNQEISEEDMIHYINNCSDDLQNSTQPVLTLDSDLLQVKGSAQLTNISEDQVCDSVQPMSIFFNRRYNFNESQDWCSQLGGSLPLPENVETNTFFYNQSWKSMRGCDDFSVLYWLDAVDNVTGGMYKMTDGKPLKWINVDSWYRANFELLCFAIDNRRFNKELAKWRITSCRRSSCGVLCSFEYSPRFTLAGKCDSFTPQIFVRMFTDVNNNIQFVGWEYRLSLVNDTWTMTKRNQQFPIAEMNSEVDTPLGRHWWSVWESGCSQDKMQLLLSSCTLYEEFTCNDGTCIDVKKRCNLILDCSDHSDEEDCEKVLLPRNYHPRLPPPSTVQLPFPLGLTLSISSVRKFCPNTFTVVIDTNLIFLWSDSRLTYKNLQSSHYDNTLPNTSQVWHPKVDIKDGYYGAVDLTHHSMDIYILKEGYPIKKSHFMDSLKDKMYSGSYNRLQMNEKQIISFRCHLNLQMYPFDTQRCSIIISVQDLHVGFEKLLKNDGKGVSFTGERYLLNYQLVSEDMNICNLSDALCMKAELTFKNLSGYYIGDVFVPSLLLTMICFVALLFPYTNFTDRVMVSLTSLLVLVGLFAQTTSNIPKTSYLKLIDCWYLAVIIFDFTIGAL